MFLFINLKIEVKVMQQIFNNFQQLTAITRILEP